jgi:hypothetical protein
LKLKKVIVSPDEDKDAEYYYGLAVTLFDKEQYDEAL